VSFFEPTPSLFLVRGLRLGADVRSLLVGRSIFCSHWPPMVDGELACLLTLAQGRGIRRSFFLETRLKSATPFEGCRVRTLLLPGAKYGDPALLFFLVKLRSEKKLFPWERDFPILMNK